MFNTNHALKFIKVDYDENLLKEQQGIYIWKLWTWKLMYQFIKIYFDHLITVNCNYICISNQNKVQYMCQDYNVIDSKNKCWILFNCICRFLIQREELISAQNHEKHISQNLESRFYFSDRCKLKEIMIKIWRSQFNFLVIWCKTVELHN